MSDRQLIIQSQTVCSNPLLTAYLTTISMSVDDVFDVLKYILRYLLTDKLECQFLFNGQNGVKK